MSRPIEVSDVLQIDAPVEAIWEVISQVDKAPSWSTAIDAVEVEGRGEFGVGSRFVEVASLMGRSLRTRKRVTEFEAPARYAEVTESGPFAHGIRIELDELAPPAAAGGARTRVRLTVSGNTPRAFALVRGLLERTLRKQIAADLRGLAAFIERSSP